MNTDDYTLLVVLLNTIMTPLFSYMLHSRCSRIKLCCIECDRQVLEPDKDKELTNETI